MTTIVQQPAAQDTTAGTASGVIIGILIAAILVALFWVYGMPRLRVMQQAQPQRTDINVTLPSQLTNPGNQNPAPNGETNPTAPQNSNY